jgi:hypothetical protein
MCHTTNSNPSEIYTFQDLEALILKELVTRYDSLLAVKTSSSQEYKFPVSD